VPRSQAFLSSVPDDSATLEKFRVVTSAILRLFPQPFGCSVRSAALDQYPTKAELLGYFAEVRRLTKTALKRMEKRNSSGWSTMTILALSLYDSYGAD
jgi:hypothetical protein